MNPDVVVAYQAALIYSCLDDFTASSALHNLYGGLYGTQVAKWKQATVDFLYRNLVAGLIEVGLNQPEYREMTPEALCRKLGGEEPLSGPTKMVSTLWISI